MSTGEIHLGKVYTEMVWLGEKHLSLYPESFVGRICDGCGYEIQEGRVVVCYDDMESREQLYILHNGCQSLCPVKFSLNKNCMKNHGICYTSYRIPAMSKRARKL